MTTQRSQLGVQMEPVEAALRKPGTNHGLRPRGNKWAPRKPDMSLLCFSQSLPNTTHSRNSFRDGETAYLPLDTPPHRISAG